MSKAKIMVIDDDADFIDFVRIVLESGGYEVRTAMSQEEGWKKLDEEVPDLITLDMMMRKGAEGFVIARKLRKDARFGKVPILMMTSMREQTGFDMPGGRIDETFLPIDEFMEKPVDPKVLLEKVGKRLAG